MVQSILLLSHSPAALLAPSDLRSARRRDVNQWVTTLHATDGETETRDKAAPAFGNVLFAFSAVSDLRLRDPTTQPQDKTWGGGCSWLCAVYGCLVTEINDISHAGSSSSRCLSSPFPELSIITVGVYFTFLHSRLLPILW